MMAMDAIQTARTMDAIQTAAMMETDGIRMAHETSDFNLTKTDLDLIRLDLYQTKAPPRTDH